MIYLDNAATTLVRKEVYDKMLPYFTEYYGNPSGVYDLAIKSKNAMEESREHIATLIGAEKEEIVFTSGGTEADNYAIKGCAMMYKDKGRHIITTKIEHHAVLESCKYLEKNGFKITYLDVDEYGIVKLDMLKNEIRTDTILLSIMMANNEIGSIQPITEIGAIAKQKGVLFHTDAVQACGHIPINVKEQGISMLSASGHKFGGPKGVGFIYISKDVNITPFMHGGSQENGRRAGTGNVPSVVGMGEAARLANIEMNKHMSYLIKLREYAITRILKEIPFVRLNGHRYKRLPGNMNFSFQFVTGESIQIMLDMRDIYVSIGSACSSESIEPSHVLMAIGLSEDLANSVIRMTISIDTTKKDIDTAINAIKEIVYKQRQLSSEYKEIINPQKRCGWRR